MKDSKRVKTNICFPDCLGNKIIYLTILLIRCVIFFSQNQMLQCQPLSKMNLLPYIYHSVLGIQFKVHQTLCRVFYFEICFDAIYWIILTHKQFIDLFLGHWDFFICNFNIGVILFWHNIILF